MKRSGAGEDQRGADTPTADGSAEAMADRRIGWSAKRTTPFM